MKAHYGAIRTLILASRYGEAEALCRKAQFRSGDQVDILAAQTMIRFENKDWAGVIDWEKRYREALER